MQAVMDFIHNPVAPIILVGVIVVLVAAVSFVVRSLKSSRTQSEVPPSTSVVPEASLPQAQESEVEGAQRSRDGPAAQTADHSEAAAPLPGKPLRRRKPRPRELKKNARKAPLLRSPNPFLHEWDVFVRAWHVRELWANPSFLCCLAAIYLPRIGKRWKILFLSQIWAWKQPMN